LSDPAGGDLLPRIFATNLVLRCYETADAGELLRAVCAERERLGEVLADPVLALRTVIDAEALIMRLRADWNEARQFVISIWHRLNGALVGECYLGGFGRAIGEAEIGIFLLQPYEKRGLAQEALRACIGAAWNMNLHTLHYRCDADNLRSCRLALRCGFSQQSNGNGPNTRVRRDGTTITVRTFTLSLRQAGTVF
jgi:RimJ/RimL family protein N-acetyltransferase